jgi:hypothetical protein
MIMPYFEELEKQGGIKSAQDEMHKQFNKQFPNGLSSKEEENTEYQSLYNYFERLAKDIASAANDKAKQDIFAEFRLNINTQGLTITNDKHFNMQHLLAAYQAYIDNFERLATKPNRDMFWQKVIGYVQRQMPANYAQAHYSGVKNVIDNVTNLKRTFQLDHGDLFFPLSFDVTSFGVGVYSYSWWSAGRGRPQWRVSLYGGWSPFLGGFGIGSLVKLCKAKTGKLDELKRAFELGKPVHSQQHRVIL